MVMALQTAGSDIQYSEYPGVGHDSWVQTYEDEEIIDWLFTNQRPLPPLGGAGGGAGSGGAGGSDGAVSGSGGAGGSVGTSGGAAGSMAQAGAAVAGGLSLGGGAGSGMGMPSESSAPSDGSCSVSVPRTPVGGRWLALVGFLALAAARLRSRRRGVRPF
jgi:hypothetical protein